MKDTQFTREELEPALVALRTLKAASSDELILLVLRKIGDDDVSIACASTIVDRIAITMAVAAWLEDQQTFLSKHSSPDGN